MTGIGERQEPALFRPIDGRRAFEEVTKQVAELIRSGRLSVGDALPPERTLAERLEVSRATLRFAVASLVEDGVLEVLPGRAGGIVVKSSWLRREDPRETRARLQPESVVALLEARRELEPRVAVLAGRRATRADLNAMTEAVKRDNESAILKATDRHLSYLEVTFRQAMDDWLTPRVPA